MCTYYASYVPHQPREIHVFSYATKQGIGDGISGRINVQHWSREAIETWLWHFNAPEQRGSNEAWYHER